VAHPENDAAWDAPPAAVLVFHPLAAPTSVGRSVVMCAFDLTAAEADVATSLANGASVEAIAHARGVSVNTVRAQLNAVYQKAGVTRQAELVRVLRDLPRLAAVTDDCARASAPRRS
jgi:DNA-binding CsgD family transcriptional regulator